MRLLRVYCIMRYSLITAIIICASVFVFSRWWPYYNKIVQMIKKHINTYKLRIVVISTTLTMLFAHMYVFTNGSLLFDSVGVYRGQMDWHNVSDRWMCNFYWWMDCGVNSPWLSGVWATILMILSVYFISETLNINSTLGIVLVGAICSVHSSIICWQEYTGQGFYGIIALMWASLAAWLIVKADDKIIRILLGGACIVFSAATYSPFVGVAPSLLIFKVIEDILEAEDKHKKNQLVRVIRYGLIFVASMAVYYAIFRVLYLFLGTPLTDYMGKSEITNANVVIKMLSYIGDAYVQLVRYYLTGSGWLPKRLAELQCATFLIGGIGLFVRVAEKVKKDCVKMGECVFVLALLLALPMSLNFIYIVAQGQVHFLMNYSYCVPFIFFVWQYEYFGREKEDNSNSLLTRLGISYVVLLVGVVYFSIVMSNAVYINYQNMYDRTQSICTRMIDRIETCDGFVGDERIVLIGMMHNDKYWEMDRWDKAAILSAQLGPGGSQTINGMTYNYWGKLVLRNVMGVGNEITIYDSIEDCIGKEGLSGKEREDLVKMQYFPRENSVRKMGDIIYVMFPSE